jgi:hypothetical protein
MGRLDLIHDGGRLGEDRECESQEGERRYETRDEQHHLQLWTAGIISDGWVDRVREP